MVDIAGGGVSVVVSASVGILAVVLLALKDPDRFDKWLSLIARAWERMRLFGRWAARARTKYAVQARLNEIMDDLASRAPYVTAPRIGIRFVATADDATAALQDGRVLIRMREQGDREGDIAAALPFALSKTVLRSTRVSLSTGQRVGLDLYLAYALASDHSDAIADRVRSSLVEQADSSTREWFARYARLHAGGLLFETFLAELDFVEERAVLASPNPLALADDVEQLLAMLEPHVGRYIDEAVETRCIGSFIRCGVVIVGRGETIRERPDAWTAYVRYRLLPRAAESVHVRGPAINTEIIQKTAQLLAPAYKLIRDGQTTSRLRDSNGLEFDQASYFAILRLAGPVAQRDAFSTVQATRERVDGVIGVVISWRSQAESGRIRLLDLERGRTVQLDFHRKQCVNAPKAVRSGMPVLCRFSPNGHEGAHAGGEVLESVEFVMRIGPEVPEARLDDAAADERLRQQEPKRARAAGYEFGREWAQSMSSRGLLPRSARAQSFARTAT